MTFVSDKKQQQNHFMRTMAKQHIKDILNESFKKKKCDKIKIKLGINWEKIPLFPLNEIIFLATLGKYLEFILVK